MSVPGLDLPAAIGPWQVLRRLGSGGAANVFQCARDGEVVAVKLLRTGLGEGTSSGKVPDQLLRRLSREAGILMRLDHPNIVRIRSVELEADPAWIVMDFVEGRHAGFLVKAGPAPATLVRQLARQLLSAMDHWHGAGVAHRDIKPGNLLVTDRGDLVVVDFGLALDASLERLSAVGVRVGTWAYAPPEWVTQEGGDPKGWDLYGAGQVLHELLIGRRAFDPKAGLMPIMLEKSRLPFLDPGPAAPLDLRELIGRLTAREPGTRPTSAADALGSLDP